ncbi:autophagic serine protease Alp2 [Geopyxis carbonaria]|nr:autophagic serine protease Alp2 [Geopyxis carbonaria]
MKLTLTAPFLALLSSITVSVASPIFDSTVVDKGAAPLLSSTSSAEHEIPNNYIVVFKKHVDDSSASEHHSWVSNIHSASVAELKKRSQEPLMKDTEASTNGFIDNIEALTGLKHTYNISGLLSGYSGSFDSSVINEIRKNPDVAYVEKDSKVYALEEPVTENSAPWGLARISHQNRLNFGNFNKYVHQANGGEGVDVYVIDTGTNTKHVDFEGRAHWGKTIPTGDADEDGNGHGTHCSGTVGGKKYGVAKKANIYAVKVLRSNGSGTMSDVVKGVEWAAEAHIKKAQEKSSNFKGSAANMSLGGGKSPTLDMAVNAAVEAGLNFAVAAGNDNADACNYSPAAAEKAVTVGASTLGDERAYFSNYGKCTDLFAPGLNIESTWIGSKYAINTISGTSMASPHVAGLLAYFLSLQPKSNSGFFTELKPAQLKKNMINIASEGVLSDIPAKTPNLLIYNGGGKDNLTEIFETPRYVEGKDNKYVDDIKELTHEIIGQTESFLEKFEGEVVGEVKAAFEKAKEALESEL